MWGLIHYRHDGSDSTFDSFRFRLADAAEPPNMSVERVFSIRVHAVDDQLPVRVRGANNAFRVEEMEVALLNNSILHYM